MKTEKRPLVSEIWNFHVDSIGPAPLLPRQNCENREKSPKCTKNDRFRQIDFLNTAQFLSSYTPFDAELHVEFCELVSMFVTLFVHGLFTKTRSKNCRRNCADPMASEKALSPATRNSTILSFSKLSNKKYSIRRGIARGMECDSLQLCNFVIFLPITLEFANDAFAWKLINIKSGNNLSFWLDYH